MNLLRPALLLATLAAAAPASAAAAPATIAPLHGDTGVSAYGGVQAWSDHDAADNRWHVIVRANGVISRPAIPASRNAIAVDVGPRSDGKPVLAYIDCTQRCRLVVARIDGSAPQVVPGTTGAREPTVWGTNVAWVHGDETVMTSTWGGHGRRVLPGVPRRKCYHVRIGQPPFCERPQDRRVDALELHGSQLALVNSFSLTQAGGEGTSEVRTESIKGGAQRLVALIDLGESGQAWIGPSWAKGRLYFYKACFGDPSGCAGGGGGAFGFDPKHNTYVQARDGTVLTGFAMDDDGRRAYEAVGLGFGEDCGSAEARMTCNLRLTAPLAFKAVRSQVREP
jgi:hypothetical protein